jgi:nucleotide-binding universal stress UspA family protein
MQQSIVCGVEASQASRSAANVAAALAGRLGHNLSLVHVARCAATYPDVDARLRAYQQEFATQRGHRLLESTAGALPAVAPDTIVLSGTPVYTFTAWSRSPDVALLVLGTRRRGRLRTSLLGGVSGRLARAAHCPVVIVPEPDAAGRFLARRSEARTIVCAVDGSRESAGALKVAGDLAERMELHVRPISVDEAAGPTLLRQAQDDDVLLVVIGFRGRRSLRLTLRALTVPVPVVVVPRSIRPAADRNGRRRRRRLNRSHVNSGHGVVMQFSTRDDGTLELSGSPRELDQFAAMVRDAAHGGDAQRGMLLNTDGVTPIVIAAHTEYESP